MQDYMDLDVLCMMAHPDDAEILAGGTLIRLKDQGYSVGVVTFARGEMGTRGTPEKRDKESLAAAEIMGVDAFINLKFPDAHIENTVENREKVVRAIRDYRPHLIITHDANNRNPDHSHVSMLVRESSFTAGLVKYETGQKPHRPNKIMFAMEYFESKPTFLIDISEQYERKLKAISCYRTQTYNPESEGLPTYIASDRFAREMDARFRYFGAKIHRDYAEPFRTDSPMEIADLVEEVALRGLIPGQGRN